MNAYCRSLLLLAGLCAAPLESVLAQDAGAGQRIAQQGGKGAAPCISCHGAQGEGNAQAGFPRIAGLPARYFAHQMKSFTDGSRNSQVMTPIAKAFDDKDIDAMASYYASLQAPATPGPKPDAAQTKRALQLNTTGDEAKRVQACANCHGPQGAGEPPIMPPLAGQHASYLGAQLKAWRDGSRKNDASMQMPAIAKQLSEQDVAGLSAWYASLPAPPAAATRALGPARAAPAPAPSAGPQQPTAPGTGTEQGSGQTGGSQGPGGSAETPGAPQRR